jgi:hydroxymethylpyrimidine/phosphomethylpyrimidine kinase
MNKISTKPPVILSLSGFDPSGGAGIQADIETISALGGYATSIITCSTAQNTQGVSRLLPTDSLFFKQQIDKLSEDVDFDAIKIGLIGSEDILQIIVNFIRKAPNIPIIFDPVLASGKGEIMSTTTLTQSMMTNLLPHILIATPNRHEAQKLSAINFDIQQSAEALLATGCQSVLITGTDDGEPVIKHHFFQTDQPSLKITVDRLQGTYHGSGCTLASAIATFIAKGYSLPESVQSAQQYCWQSLNHAHTIGKGQLIPDRFFEKRQ